MIALILDFQKEKGSTTSTDLYFLIINAKFYTVNYALFKTKGFTFNVLH